MTYTPIEIIAMIFLALGVIKMIYLVINPNAWMDLAKKMYAKPKALQSMSLILAAIVFYYLIQVFSIVEIFAVMTFMALLIVFGMANHVGKMLKIFKIKSMWKDFWLYLIIWIVLMVWAIKELFFNSLF
ncbi:hypothetical protein HOA59_00830 [archaeon]|jgi:hypothetical protein|nr:hypothetical protein [archaeon]MBT6823964.1 hypothetical protein [archaeon]MBT7107194.1 hypothetical protein [archaeon]MBT7297736.1 hypothetical protein [archaeon]